MAVRKKTRKLLTAKPHQKGLLKISTILRELPIKSSVVVDYNPSFQAGISHRRFQGKVGIVQSKSPRRFYKVLINNKILITTAPHLKLLNHDN